MTKRSGMSDDDEAPALPEVTVPPWLRTGPDPGTPPTSGPATDTRDADTGRAREQGAADLPAAAPTRITLGAQGREVGSAGPAVHGGPTPGEDPGYRRGGTARPAEGDRPVDELSTLPLRTAARGPARSEKDAQGPERAADGAGASIPILSRRPVRIALAAVAGVAVLGGSAVLGFVVTRGATGGDAGPEAAAAAATAGCEDVTGSGLVVGSGPGALDSPAGAVLAFDHAYYVDRSAEKAFEAVAPSSRMTEDQLRAEGIDLLADGTTHCVRVSEIAPTLLEVELTEFPPGAEPILIRQRIRVAENPDGTWGIVSITPAG